ncbi:MAG: WD40 repeat domain-containing protein [Chloroflexi bacterium]|nr:WD40 repeat domain-containing protein [Chloroflexota bacterium]
MLEKIDGNPWFNTIFARRLRHKEYVRRFNVAPNGNHLLSYQTKLNLSILFDFGSSERERILSLWDISSKTTSAQFVVEHGSLVDFSAAGGLVAIKGNGEPEVIEIRDLTSEQVVGRTSAYRIKFSADGSQYAVSNETEIALFDARTGTLDSILSFPEQVTWVDVETMAFSENDRFLAARSSESLLVWDLSTGQLEVDLPFSASPYRSHFTVSPDGRYLTFTERFDIDEYLDEAYVNVWDISGNKLAYRTKLGRDRFISVESIAFSPGNRVLGVGLRDEIILFDLAQMPKAG